jgi:hypothetical protein
MILQEGKYYRSIRGDVFGPLVEFARKEGSFFLNEEESWRLNEYPFSYDGDVWSKNGVCGTGQLKDLVAEVYVSDAPVIQSGAPPKVDRVEIASRILPRLAPDLAPTSAARQALQYADAFIKEIGND